MRAEMISLSNRLPTPLLFFLLFISRECAADQEGPMLSPQTTLVLINGLPGDTESEALYREQLNAWIEIALHHDVRRILILSDEPESIPARDKTGVTAIQANQKQFQKLPELLTGET